MLRFIAGHFFAVISLHIKHQKYRIIQSNLLQKLAHVNGSSVSTHESRDIINDINVFGIESEGTARKELGNKADSRGYSPIRTALIKTSHVP